MPEDQERLPIKIVIPQDTDLGPPPSGGGPVKVFDEVDESVRDRLLGEVAGIREHFGNALSQKGPPAVARVVLKENAIAKTYRPRHLFTASTCPLIGGETFGRLLVSVTSQGLGRLEESIGHNTTQAMTADLSTIDRMEPYTAADAFGAVGLEGMKSFLTHNRVEKLKFQLFRHRNAHIDHQILSEFRRVVSELRLPEPEPLNYATGMLLYRVRNVTPEHLPRLAGFVGTQSVRPFPSYRVETQYIPQGRMTPAHLPPPEAGVDYPLVGLIDTGTDPNNPHLQAWVARRDETDTPRADQSNDHGSFVAGLVANARGFNHNDGRFPSARAKVVDVVALPRNGPISEDDLIEIIRRAVTTHREVRVWNLSISSTGHVCQDDTFSHFAIELDDLQQRYDVTFVTCAGNYQETPFRGWPAHPATLGERDRIYPPADSLYGVAVGSIAHRDHATSCVRVGQPSPFSRRGPGAAWLPKPEVCHIGGNCDETGDYQQVGVLSVNGSGEVSESIGTSFSTPLVATTLAALRAGVADPVSRNLAKALLIQSAALNSEELLGSELHYKGFGVPTEISEILTCAPWQATLIFELELPPQRRVFTKADFPIPDCFRRSDGTVEGDFLMTLVSSPPRDPSAGAEYCRVNIDVSLGTYDVKNGKPAHKIQIPLQPKDVKDLYERNQVEHGFKWSPVKVFRRKLSRTSGERWRLQMRVMYRDEMEFAEPQSVALVATVFDPERRKPVYDDVVRAMARAGWVTQDLRVTDRVRARARR